MDQRRWLLLEALKTGALHPGETRLYRSGKIPGLFAQRTHMHAEVATEAVRDGLLEVVRIEARGKSTLEWVRVTPKGREFLLQQESPARALQDLRELLALQASGMPGWLDAMRQQLDAMQQQFLAEVTLVRQQLDHLAARVTETLQRFDQANVVADEPTVAWASDAIQYLGQRGPAGLPGLCSLGELFSSLRQRHPDLAVKDFHLGLRRLHERELLQLLPHRDGGLPPGPEFALLDGASVYYYAAAR
jgi:hypothetical protein